MSRVRPARLVCFACCVGMMCAVARAQVQQLPPGTSSSADPSETVVTADKAMQAAETRMAQQDWQGAIALLKPQAEAARPSAEVLYDLGFCEESLNDTAAANTAYVRAIGLDREAVLPRVALGLLQARSGDPTGAEASLASAVGLKGDGSPGVAAAQAQAYRALARLHLQTAPERARDELLLALRRSPEQSPDIQLAGEIAEALHDDAAAEQAYARLFRVTPDDADTASEYARVLGRENKTNDALAVLEAGLKSHPEDASLLGEKAGVLLHEKDVTGALPLLERLHVLRPTDQVAARLLARAYVAQGQSAKADALYQQLVAADPANGDVVGEWCDSLIRQKRNAEAETLLTRALEGTFSTSASRARAAEELAFAASNTHHPEVVLRAISIRSAILPLDASSAFLLATAHDSLHQSREAAGSYRQFLELAHGNFPDEEWQAQQRLLSLSRAK